MTATVGLWGKLPSRGDFVRTGLPRSFVTPWDAWWAAALNDLGDRRPDWREVWLSAPVWAFSLAAGCCGPDPVLGLFLPSVDRVGRYFPLTIAALPCSAWDEPFLAAAAAVGRDALADGLAPDEIVRHLVTPDQGRVLHADCVFRTEGGDRVLARDERHPGLPPISSLPGMIDDDWREDGSTIISLEPVWQ